MSATTDSIREFIATELDCAVPREELTDDLLLIDQRVIDSIAIFQVIDFLESQFDIEVLDEELLPENFSSINAMARLVDSKGNAGS
jgi:acyl carrier protein